MQLLMAASKADAGPWCSVRYAKQIEVQDASKDSHVMIDVKDKDLNYSIIGATTKEVNIPEGYIRVRRLKGSTAITVYAHCGV
jgi:hypothetical protein